MFYIGAAFLMVLGAQAIYWHGGSLWQGVLDAAAAAGTVLLHPSTGSPVTFAILAVLAILAGLCRANVFGAVTKIAVAAIPVVVFLASMNAIAPREFANNPHGVGAMVFHDWSGIIKPRKTHERLVELAKDSEASMTAYHLDVPCRRAIDVDSAAMDYSCAVVACLHLGDGTIETYEYTRSMVDGRAGLPRKHVGLRERCPEIEE